MSRLLFVLYNDAIRRRAVDAIRHAPPETRVEMKDPKRTLPQNSRLYAMLTDISMQLDWHGEQLSVQDWKLLFLDALNRETRLVPALDGAGFVNLGRSSSDLSKEEMSDLIELLFMFGASHGVEWSEPKERAA